jgi:ABC-type branched-subunit amino acid transport system substrate-binding protein
MSVAAGMCVLTPGIASASSTTTSSTPTATTSTAAAGKCANDNSAPGVTANSINVGAMSTLTGPIASNFESLVPGIQAYFDYTNATGGINGRKIHLAYNTDDTGNPSEDTTLAHTLIDQDHVFAVAGVATAFFEPSYFVQTCTPTFGYNVTGNWSGPPNLYGAGGSVQDYAAGSPSWIWMAKKVEKNPSVGVLAYNIASSNQSCNTAVAMMKAAGMHVSYQDTSISYGGSVIPDAERMKAAGTNFILSCMDVSGNISLARGVQQYGIKAKQLWLNGNDQSTLDQYQSLMQGVYFNIQHVPFSSPLSRFPGLKTYITAMKKYEPKFTYDEVAIQGWEAAHLLVAGLKAAGPNPTQAKVIAAINSNPIDTSGGLTTNSNWTANGGAHNYPITHVGCSAYIIVKGDKFVTTLAPKAHPFVCFKTGTADPSHGLGSYFVTAKHAVPVPAPVGTPNG